MRIAPEEVVVKSDISFFDLIRIFPEEYLWFIYHHEQREATEICDLIGQTIGERWLQRFNFYKIVLDSRREFMYILTKN